MATTGAKKVAQPVETSDIWKKWVGGILIALGMITFFLAQSTLWVSNNFFNEDTFVGTVQNVLSTEQSREAISSTIVHNTLQNNPVAEQLIGKQLTALVNGLLGSDIAGQVFDRVAHRTYAYLTSTNRQDITIDLTSIKDPLTVLVGLIERTGRDVKFNPSNIPDKITLVESDSLPDVGRYIRIVMFASGILWLTTIVAYVAYIYLYRKKLVRSLYIVGWSILAVCAFALASGPFIPPAIASLVNLIDIRGVVEDLTKAFLEPFQVQLLSTAVVVAFIMLIISLRDVIRLGFTKLITLFNKE
jgi:hypothetical protein